MSKMISALIILLLSCGVAFSEDIESGDNSVVVNDVNGNVSITYLNLKEEMLRNEIEKIVGEIRKRGDSETKQLVDKLQILRKELSVVVEEKNRLAKMVYVYRKKLESLTASRNYGKSKENDTPTIKSDMKSIESSSESREVLSKIIKESKGEHRMLSLLDILIHDTESMEDDERGYWKDIFPSMTFNQKFRLFEILSVERFKLAELERKYIGEIKALNNKHLKEWLEFQIKDAKKNKDQKMLRLLAVKEKSLIEPSVQDLRDAETLLNSLITDEPQFLEAYLHYIEVLNKYDDDRSYDAKVIMERAKSQFSNSGEFYKELGYIYLRLGEDEKAYPYLRDASMLLNEGKLHRIFSSMAIKRGDALLAKSIMDGSYESNKDDAKFVSLYSYVLDENGESEKAISMLSDSIDKNKKEDRLYFSLGWRYYGANDYENAKGNFLESSKLNLKNYGSLLMAALANIELGGDVKESLKLAEKCLKSFMYTGSTREKDKGEIYLALSVFYAETEALDKVVEYSSSAVNNTYGCSEDYMKEERNWRSKTLALLNKHRLSIGCP